MLTFEDNPLIRNAIMKRLDKERGIAIADLQMSNRGKGGILVGLWIVLKDVSTADCVVDLKTFFLLPPEFMLRHLHNEIDEIAEQCKKARRQVGIARLTYLPGAMQERVMLPGTGLMGRWGKDAPKDDAVPAPVVTSTVGTAQAEAA